MDGRTARNHSFVSSYPNQYEMRVTTKGGLDIFVRPIKPEDAPLLIRLFHTLSQKSIYYRLLSPLKRLPPDMLARFTQIDYDRDMAVVALDYNHEEEKMLGVARFMGYPDGKRGEIAVAVGDPWQGKGVGATLMQHLIAIAKEREFETLWGIVLAENTHMLALARSVGAQVSFIPGAGQYEIKINLKEISMDENHARTIHNPDS